MLSIVQVHYFTVRVATTLKTDAEKAKVEFKEAKEYLEKLIPLLSPSKPAQKKMIDNANTMLNFINTQL